MPNLEIMTWTCQSCSYSTTNSHTWNSSLYSILARGTWFFPFALCLYVGGRRAGKCGLRKHTWSPGHWGQHALPRTHAQWPCEPGMRTQEWGTLPRGRGHCLWGGFWCEIAGTNLAAGLPPNELAVSLTKAISWDPPLFFHPKGTPLRVAKQRDPHSGEDRSGGSVKLPRR